MDSYQPIVDLLGRVRARWLALRVLQALVRTLSAVSLVLIVALIVMLWTAGSAVAAGATGLATLLFGIAGVLWGLAPLRRGPSDAQLARFIEERVPALDDRLVTAVDLLKAQGSGLKAPMSLSALAGPMLADAAARSRALSADAVVPNAALRGTALRAAGAVLIMAVVAFVASGPARQAADAASLVLFPSRVERDTRPIVVAHTPPRVTRIDVDYVFPRELGLKPRSERDSGDIFAPLGTDVRVSIHTDRPVVSGRRVMGGGEVAPLTIDAPTQASTTLKVVKDDTYRVAVVDREGLSNDNETEYFIRLLNDRPPEVHITKPGGDRSVTRLEEVEIEAQADDDHGLESVDLVYAVRGAEEHVVTLNVPRHSTTASARHTLYLEDLDVQPGDFISYYVRARDLGRGGRSNETRSDIFFLDVRPFEQEFSLAQSQSMSGSGYTGAIDELVNDQRQVVVATWTLDRRARNAGMRSARDVRSVARTEAALRSRVEQTASAFRQSTMRDPRSRFSGGAGPDQKRAEEDAMSAAALAMGRAVTSLDALTTAAALPAEMEALNHLLQAQADIKHRQLAMDQSAAGAAGNNNRNYDISMLFDRELRRQQQTTYEMPKSREARPESSALDQIRNLARRQDELLKRQQDLMGRAQAPDGERELKRQLEQLTREQSALRQAVEELARESTFGQPGQAGRSEGGRDSRRQMQDIAGAMGQASSELRRGATRQAGASAGRALDKLRDLEKRLQASGPAEAGGAERQRLLERPRQSASSTGPAQGATDATRRLTAQLERARDLRNKLDQVSPALEAAGRQRGQATGEPSAQKTAGERGRTGEGRQGAGGSDLSQLSEESLRHLREAEQLLDQLKREDPSISRNGAGFTLEGQGTISSAPGTEAFKQDSARWEALRRQAVSALEQVESALSKKVQVIESKNRLAAGLDDRAPPEYQAQVERYFKALADPRPGR